MFFFSKTFQKCQSKLVDCIVAAQIRSHIDLNYLSNTFQSAYKAGHFTETALLCIQDEIHFLLSKGMSTALVLLDRSATFDTIMYSSPVYQQGLALPILS